MISEQTLAFPQVRETSRSEMGVILTMLVATFVVILNETIMNVALPELMVYFQVGTSTVQWLTTGFMLTMAVLIPTTGYLMQRFSTRTLFLSAMGIFMVGTLVAGFAPIFGVLLVGRVLQASGTAVVLPLLTTTILALIPAHRRGTMMGTSSVVISVAPALGPTISGIILQNLNWRYMFFFVIPIALAVWIYGARYLINVGVRRKAALDIPSVILSILGFGGLVYGFSSAGEGGGSFGPMVWVTILVGIMSLTLFARRQFRLEAPMLDLRAFRYPMFRLGVIMISLVMMALFASALLLPIFMQNVRQFDPLRTGLLLLPGGVLMGLASPLVGRVFDRYGPRVLVTVGASLMTVMLLFFTQLSATTPVPYLMAMHMGFSGGLALMFTPLSATALNQLPKAFHSHGSAIMSTLQQVAGAIGTAVLVTVLSLRSASLVARGEVNEVAVLTSGLHAAFAVAAGVAFVLLLLTTLIRRSAPPVDEANTVDSATFATH